MSLTVDSREYKKTVTISFAVLLYFDTISFRTIDPILTERPEKLVGLSGSVIA